MSNQEPRFHSHLQFIRRKRLRELFAKQESIPVGPILPVSVAITR